MNKQKYFNFEIKNNLDLSNYFVNETNNDAFLIVNNKKISQNIFLVGPNKSGKTHIANIWKNNNQAVIYNGNNIDKILKQNKNILIDNLFDNLDEEKVFHLINHCISNNLFILITSQINLYEYKFNIPDLLSRLKVFQYAKIHNPNDEMLINVLTKLLNEKQFIIKNNEIFDFLLKRIHRTYEDVYNIVKKMDNMSLEKKQQLTIPSIKKLI